MISKADVVSTTVNPSVINDLIATVTPTATVISAAVAVTSKETFVYEIHCEGVAQSVSVAELVRLC